MGYRTLVGSRSFGSAFLVSAHPPGRSSGYVTLEGRAYGLDIHLLGSSLTSEFGSSVGIGNSEGSTPESVAPSCVGQG